MTKKKLIEAEFNTVSVNKNDIILLTIDSDEDYDILSDESIHDQIQNIMEMVSRNSGFKVPLIVLDANLDFSTLSVSEIDALIGHLEDVKELALSPEEYDDEDDEDDEFEDLTSKFK